jgi:hypothetical protein
VRRAAANVSSKSRSGDPYLQIAVILVAITRSSVSAKVVYRSRGKPLKPERVVFIATRSSTPASMVVSPRVAAAVAMRVPSPPRRKASGASSPATSIGRQWWARTLTVDRSTCSNSRKCSARARAYSSIDPPR